MVVKFDYIMDSARMVQIKSIILVVFSKVGKYPMDTPISSLCPVNPYPVCVSLAIDDTNPAVWMVYTMDDTNQETDYQPITSSHAGSCPCTIHRIYTTRLYSTLQTQYTYTLYR